MMTGTGASGREAWGGRWPGDTDGTVSIEFAILVPLFLALLFGLIVFGVQYSTRIALTYAASEGGRAAVAGLSDPERQTLALAAAQRALRSLSPLISVDKADVDVEFAREADGEDVTVSIAYVDTRFARLPFVPSMNNLPPVVARYRVTDPAG
jgi:Flp pilus assembly protein TadG